jgi:hypothetical protein
MRNDDERIKDKTKILKKKWKQPRFNIDERKELRKRNQRTHTLQIKMRKNNKTLVMAKEEGSLWVIVG